MTTSIRSLAAQIWDKDENTEADLIFLAAIARADKEWTAQLDAANLTFGGGSETWEIVKRLATRSRDAAYDAAYLAYASALIGDETEFAEAAE